MYNNDSQEWESDKDSQEWECDKDSQEWECNKDSQEWATSPFLKRILENLCYAFYSAQFFGYCTCGNGLDYRENNEPAYYVGASPSP